jgi:DNA-binding PadR family transcriptional regulator
MNTSLNTGTALLVEMLRGPGYGLDLIERVQAHSGRRIRLRQGVVYPALKDFNRRKLARKWSVVTPGSGRPRTYYDLTTAGIALALAHRDAIAGFAATTTSRRPPAPMLAKMGARLFQCGEVSEAADWLQRAGKASQP